VCVCLCVSLSVSSMGSVIRPRSVSVSLSACEMCACLCSCICVRLLVLVRARVDACMYARLCGRVRVSSCVCVSVFVRVVVSGSKWSLKERVFHTCARPVLTVRACKKQSSRSCRSCVGNDSENVARPGQREAGTSQE